MNGQTSKTVAVFTRPFTVAGLGETLPAGKYDIETELASPPEHPHPESWTASVLVKLHPRASHPGLARTMTVSLANLETALARDQLTSRTLSDFFLEEMLADPMVSLVMKADGVSGEHLRHLYSGLRTARSDSEVLDSRSVKQTARDKLAIQAAENEGMPSLTDGALPSRTRAAAGRT